MAGKYDVSDVKSVQKFSVDTKDLFDKVNKALPEDAEVKLEFDSFMDKFYKANEGIIKNRDTLKQEKLALSEEFASFKTQTEEKWGSIDENIQNMYNEVVTERDALKATIKDGKVDVDGMNAKFESEKQALEKSIRKEYEDLKVNLTTENESLKGASEKYQSLFFAKLKKEALADELDRINVNPEDRHLVIQANLGRAEIAQNGDNFDVVFKSDDGTSVAKSAFWDSWANDSHNQRYVKAPDNSGGGAGGSTKTEPTSERAKIIQALEDPKTPLASKFALRDQLRTMS